MHAKNVIELVESIYLHDMQFNTYHSYYDDLPFPVL